MQNNPESGSLAYNTDDMRSNFAINHISDMVLWVERSGRILEVNTATLNITGFTKGELLSKSIYDLCVNCTPINWISYWNRTDSQEDVNIHCKIQTKSFLELPVSVSCICPKDGEPDEICVIASHLPEKSSEAAIIQRMQYEYDNLLYRLSHDLRAPLTTLQGLINLFQEECTDTQKEYLSLMDGTISRQNLLMEKIHELSTVHSTTPKPEPIDIDSFMEGLVGSIIDEEPGDINWCFFSRSSYATVTDRNLLVSLMTPIIENAIQYKKSEVVGRMIKISTGNTDSVTTIEIEDNGSGIAREALPRIFDMFYRGSEMSSGSGLGLYLSRLSADKINARISVRSINDIGTSFKIRIPHLKQSSLDSIV